MVTMRTGKRISADRCRPSPVRTPRKVGFTFQHQESRATQNVSFDGTLLTLLNGRPASVTVWATPLELKDINKANLGLHAQDRWTVGRIAVNAGVRFDYFNSYVPAHHLGPGPYAPDRSVDFAPVYNVPNWTDVSPRLGASYDLFAPERRP